MPSFRLDPVFRSPDELAGYLESLHEATDDGAVTNSKCQTAQLAASVVRSPALQLLVAERLRQVSEEGWSPEHDDGHGDGELARAAAFYAMFAGMTSFQRVAIPPPTTFDGWPWDAAWWKPGPDSSDASRIRELVKAGALIAAEIERLQRRAPAEAPAS